MLDKDTLAGKAAARHLSIRNAEKDYLLETCLFVISREGRSLVFKGGTALYKFHNLNRFSEDLDFTLAARRFDAERLRDRLARSAEAIGIGTRAMPVEAFRNQTNLRFLFRGPLYDGRPAGLANVALNISLRERPVTGERRMLVPVYEELPAFELYVMEGRELLAEKIRAVLTREKPRDVYDAWFLLRKGVAIDIPLVNRKLKAHDKIYSAPGFIDAMRGKRGRWRSDLHDLIIGRVPDFDEVAAEIEERAGKE